MFVSTVQNLSENILQFTVNQSKVLVKNHVLFPSPPKANNGFHNFDNRLEEGNSL